MTYVNNGSGGRPAGAKTRAEQDRQMRERLEQQAIERKAERERSRLSDIESRKRWDETYAAMNLEDIIEIPGKQGGKDIVIRAIVGPSGRLIEVKE